MSPLKSKKFGFSAAAIIVFGLALSQGCSSSDDSQAAPTAGTSSGGTGGHAGTATGGSGTAGHAGTGTGGSSTGATGGTGGTGGAGGSPDMGMAGEGGAADCSGPDGCYDCAPSTTTQFLNHCVAGGCQPAQDFHLPATLPALP
jgi:hypothetical protein